MGDGGSADFEQAEGEGARTRQRQRKRQQQQVRGLRGREGRKTGFGDGSLIAAAVCASVRLCVCASQLWLRTG
jgi:hypothetical protein